MSKSFSFWGLEGDRGWKYFLKLGQYQAFNGSTGFIPRRDQRLHVDSPRGASGPLPPPHAPPPGTLLEIERKVGPERYRAPECLFHPEQIGSECLGVHDCLVKGIMRADMDMRRTLFGQVVLSGGSTLFPGFGDRLLNEVKAPSSVSTSFMFLIRGEIYIYIYNRP